MTEHDGDVDSDVHFFQSPAGHLVQIVESDRRKLWMGNVIGAALAGLLVLLGIHVAWATDVPSILLAMMLIALPIAVVSFSAYSQWRVWRRRGDSTLELVELALELRSDEVRRMRLLRAVAPMVFVMGLLRAGLLWRNEAPAASLAAGVVPGVLMALLFRRAGRRIRESTGDGSEINFGGSHKGPAGGPGTWHRASEFYGRRD